MSTTPAMWRTAIGSSFNVFPAGVQPEELARHFVKARTLEGEDQGFFVFWADAVAEAMAEWRRELPNIETFYAVKCNPDPLLLRCLASLGSNFDCASSAEMRAVLEIPGVKPDQIVFANPCKTRSHIRAAEALGVTAMTFDNEEELRKIHSIHPNAQLILRLAISDPTAICVLSNKFGCEPGSKAEELISEAAALGMAVNGISFHVGSGCRDGGAYATAIRRAAELVRFGRGLGLGMELIDIGGGFPGSGTKGATSFADLAGIIRSAVEIELADLKVRVIAEPGRFFATRAFSLVVNIIAKKIDSTGCQHMYINDGVYGSFNCKFFDHAEPMGEPLYLSEDEAEEGKKKGMKMTKVWGTTCDGIDCVLDKVLLPPMEEGDWMLFKDMGAYTSAASTHFNGFAPPQPVYNGSLGSAKMAGASENVTEERIRCATHVSDSDYSSNVSDYADAVYSDSN